jgi:hypothetical protein
MSSRAKRRTKKLSQVDDSVWNLKTIAFLVVILACISLVIFGFYRLRMSQVASLPPEFEGLIVEKWTGFNDTEQGSYPYFRLVVDVDGARFTVPVYIEIYQAAQVGMRLKKTAKGLEVVRPLTLNGS